MQVFEKEKKYWLNVIASLSEFVTMSQPAATGLNMFQDDELLIESSYELKNKGMDTFVHYDTLIFLHIHFR